MKSPKPTPTPVGTALPDLVLRAFSSPILVIPVLLLFAGLVISIALGFIEVSWGDNGLKLTQGSKVAGSSDLNIAGAWHGIGRDLTAGDHKLQAVYSYKLSIDFVQKGLNVEMHGTYFINEDRSLPQGTISGRGVIHGDYLDLLYDVEVGQPPLARAHGAMCYKIRPSSSIAEGYFISRSIAKDGFVFGSLYLSR